MIAKAISLREGEEILTIVRRHWFSLAVEGAVNIFIFVLVAAALVVADASLITAGGSGEELQVLLPVGFFALGFIGLLLWMHFFASWSDHWLDAWVVTTERVVDIEQHGFFKREVSSFPLSKVQDVTYTVSGIIPTWLHFGDVRIQTASISEDFIMKQIPFPDLVRDRLEDLLQESKKG